MRRNIIGAVLVAFGVIMLLDRMGFEWFDWFFAIDWHRYIFPLAVIFAGIMVLMGGKKIKGEDKKTDSKDYTQHP